MICQWFKFRGCIFERGVYLKGAFIWCILFQIYQNKCYHSIHNHYVLYTICYKQHQLIKYLTSSYHGTQSFSNILLYSSIGNFDMMLSILKFFRFSVFIVIVSLLSSVLLLISFCCFFCDVFFTSEEISSSSLFWTNSWKPRSFISDPI